ncbi:MAG: hypothetical protein GX080_06500 [Tissierellia bacterium]|nr:hypothetical protein [Tissierellia bacterium]
MTKAKIKGLNSTLNRIQSFLILLYLLRNCIIFSIVYAMISEFSFTSSTVFMLYIAISILSLKRLVMLATLLKVLL